MQDLIHRINIIIQKRVENNAAYNQRILTLSFFILPISSVYSFNCKIPCGAFSFLCKLCKACLSAKSAYLPQMDVFVFELLLIFNFSCPR